MKNIIKFGLMTLAFIGAISLSSCNKKEDTIAKIIVLDSANQKVAGATVQLSAEPTVDEFGQPVVPGELAWSEPLTSTTNSAGEATFNFNDIFKKGQAGVVVANIAATHDGKSGTGIIKVEEEVTSETTVFISQ